MKENKERYFEHFHYLGDRYSFRKAEQEFVKLFGVGSRIAVYGYFFKLCEMSLKQGNSHRPFLHTDDLEMMIETIAQPQIPRITDDELELEIAKVKWVLYQSGLFQENESNKTFIAKGIEFVLE